jgi:hypothetical protein
MDGTNSAGRKVSLLNDHEPPNYLVRLNSFAPSLRSRTSSYDSSSIGSPPTPQLVRSTSSDSTSMQTPSPITPDFAFDGQDSSDYTQTSFFPQQKEMFSHMNQHNGAVSYNNGQPQHPVYYSQPQMMDTSVSAPPSAAQVNGRPKKNQYPCPMAKTIGCKDFFTTSGHAARHAKKHTGKKDAVCPECNKAFTRKDNMEQHRRTHQTGRGSTKASDSHAKKVKSRTQRAKSELEQQSPTLTPSLAPASIVDPSLAGPYPAPMQLSDPFAQFTRQRQYPDPTGCAITSNTYSAGSSYGGLDALASAASREQHRFDDEFEVESTRHLHSHQLEQ